MEIKNPIKMWWAGDPRVEPYMSKVRDAIKRHLPENSTGYTDIYNRAYESVYAAIKDSDKKMTMKNALSNESRS